MIEGFASLYYPKFARSVVYMLRISDYHPLTYLRWFWRTNNFNRVVPERGKLTFSEWLLIGTLQVGIIGQIIVCALLAWWGYHSHIAGLPQISLAAALAAPIIWSQLLLLPALLYWILWSVTHPRTAGKAWLCMVLEWQVRRLRHRHPLRIVAVVGSVGKTGTKLAIAKTLQAGLRVVYQEGNYNDRLTVPLVLFKTSLPNLMNIPAWFKLIISNEGTLKGEYPYDVAVLELGTDSPGQIGKFAYLAPDISVVTALTPEHMEYFDGLEGVAKEELAVAKYSAQTLINTDDSPRIFLKDLEYLSYGLKRPANYLVNGVKRSGLKPQSAKLQLDGNGEVQLKTKLLGDQGLKALAAAGAVAHLMGLDSKTAAKGVSTVEAFPGRLQLLSGKKKSTIIDDSYNSSPAATKAALDVLYSAQSKQRIAILGGMNEFGKYAEEAHREVGSYCNPKKLDLVVTIGEQAQQWLAPATLSKGCMVESFLSPYDAGDCVKKHLKNGAVILVKGSQNRVFAEEAIKTLLSNKEDTSKLVRQSKYWMTIKRGQFGS